MELKSDMPGMSGQHVSHTHASSEKVGSYLFIDHIEEVNMNTHVQNPFL